jgi:peptide/bleomycin uptake transporter
MIKEFYWSKRWASWAWGGALILFISLYAQVYMSVLLNEWYGEFYNYFQPSLGGTIEGFWGAFNWFFKLVAVYIVLALWTGWFTRIYAFRWRKAMTFSYIPKWRNVKEDVEGASQRIQLDTERYARIVESLGLQAVRAVMTLIAFTPILWKLSEGVLIKIKDWEVPFLYSAEGNLVWVAITATGMGMLISWFVGWYLPGLEFKNQVVEAAYRKELAFAEDFKDKYALPKTVARLFFGLEKNYHRLFLHYGYFDLWYNAYDQVMSILPYIVVGPSVVLATVPLGVLIQVSNAFGKVHGSMSLFISNWTTITELRSIWKRLHEFEANITKYNRDTDTDYLKRKEAELYQFEFGHGITYAMLLKIFRPYNWVMTRVVDTLSRCEGFIRDLLWSVPLWALLCVFVVLIRIAIINLIGG